MAFSVIVPAWWVGNQRLFANRVALSLEQKLPLIGKLNDVTYAAPLWKWALSVLPLVQIFQGIPPVEKIEKNQAAALCLAGVVWSYYGTLIQPQNFGSLMFVVCNGAMASVHGYNLYRRYRSEQSATCTLG